MLILAAGCLSLLTQGPVGYWRGDEPPGATVAVDSSGNGRDGSFVSGATTSAATLPPGLFHNVSAFSLNGTNAQIQIPHNAAFNLTGEMTVAFWMRKAGEPGDWVRVVGKGAGAVRTFGVWEQPATGLRLLFQQYNGSSVSVLDLNSSEDVPTLEWRHVACKIERNATTMVNQASIYINGQLRGGPVDRPNTPGTDTQPVRIGFGEIHTYFNGLVDEVRLFNRPLSLTEIHTLAGLVQAAVPQNVRTQSLSPSSVTIEWDAAAGANTYVVQRAGPGATPFATIASGIAGTSYTDSAVNWGDLYSYRVYAVGLVDSADSASHSVTIPFPAPRTEDHEEGLFGDNCACGATSRGASAGWALLALLPLFFRRR